MRTRRVGVKLFTGGRPLPPHALRARTRTLAATSRRFIPVGIRHRQGSCHPRLGQRSGRTPDEVRGRRFYDAAQDGPAVVASGCSARRATRRLRRIARGEGFQRGVSVTMNAIATPWLRWNRHSPITGSRSISNRGAGASSRSSVAVGSGCRAVTGPGLAVGWTGQKPITRQTHCFAGDGPPRAVSGALRDLN